MKTETIEKTFDKKKVEFLIGSVKETFPNIEEKYKDAGFKEFDKDLRILLEWFCTPNRNKSVPSKSVDEIWHRMILYTKKYPKWCKLHFGAIIHHIPSEKESCYCDDSCSDCDCCHYW